jgi:Eukaryotic aspartyl protease
LLTFLDNGVGSILFGGIDSNKYKGSLVSLPIQPDSPAGIITSFTVALDGFKVVDAAGASPFSPSNMATPVIFDSGTTVTYMPDEIANKLYEGVGAVNSNVYGVVVPCDVGTSNATFEFTFGNAKGPRIVAPIAQFVLPFPSEFPAPTFHGSGKVGCRWGILASQGRPNLFGDTFLRGAYVVYNLENNEVAIAQANLNSTSSNIVEIAGKKLPNIASTATGTVTSLNRHVPSMVPHTLFGPLHRTRSAEFGASATAPTFNLGSTKTTLPTASEHSRGRKSSAGEIVAPSLGLMVSLVLGCWALVSHGM